MEESIQADPNPPPPFHPTNPFADYPTTPPPAYNFHIRDPEAGLPPFIQSQHNYPHNTPITPLKTVATNITYRSSPNYPRYVSTNKYSNQKKYNRRRIMCFCLAAVVIVIIPLVILGTVFHWGRENSFCVRWSDGSTSGDC
ncbi:hypothetical protein ONS95_006311 [Cadophora gregata]|uniref:uncharacterized protein n=1 Tax=Cadophora gregata TaxID=51156 RepID=UPI0026DC7647|nr:uncharacterized protein ONS95_006311 [Cadophora gregata]KAK0102709.1 hypothetical protein ONS95_006311 [Cadophora gregata]